MSDHSHDDVPVQDPPEVWRPARAAARALVRPVERFLQVQAASGLLLLAAALIAMVWANSPWHESYEHLWHTPIGFSIGHFEFSHSLHFWINDGLMVAFFFVVGMEIRREIHSGELSNLKRAALPIAAAVGGMLVPALIYWGFNVNHPEVLGGWGTPMATDIAFAVGILALIGNRVPAALRILLLALAVIDDMGAILIIAVFYSGSISWIGLAVAAGGMLGITLFQRVGLRSPLLYVVPAFAVWEGMLQAGIHPTIAGVIVGLMTPVRSWFGEEGFLHAAERALFRFKESRGADDQHDLLHPLEDLERAQREALPPVVRLEHKLNPWVSYGVMPLFALANAGVPLGDVSLEGAAATSLALGVGVGLALGKPAGVLLLSWISKQLGLVEMPRGVDFKGLLVVGLVAGIGFTMALFIANLAFTNPEHLGIAKLAVLTGSLVAGVLGLAVGIVVLPREQTVSVAQAPPPAEGSAEV